jgi:hypothetical protein
MVAPGHPLSLSGMMFFERNVMKTEERRNGKRFRVVPLLCHTQPKTSGLCVLRDVSISGAFFQTPDPPMIGTHLMVEFTEDPLDGYELAGKVIRHASGQIRGFGVTFHHPHPKLLRAVYCSH